jgi:hypothetical protein
MHSNSDPLTPELEVDRDRVVVAIETNGFVKVKERNLEGPIATSSNQAVNVVETNGLDLEKERSCAAFLASTLRQNLKLISDERQLLETL